MIKMTPLIPGKRKIWRIRALHRKMVSTFPQQFLMLNLYFFLYIFNEIMQENNIYAGWFQTLSNYFNVATYLILTSDRSSDVGTLNPPDKQSKYAIFLVSIVSFLERIFE